MLLKLRELNWTKVELEYWNELWWHIGGEFCILAKIIMTLSPNQCSYYYYYYYYYCRQTFKTNWGL